MGVCLVRNSVTGRGIYPGAIVFAECEPFPNTIFVGDVIDRFIVERRKYFLSRAKACILRWDRSKPNDLSSYRVAKIGILSPYCFKK